jgi:hypothetical protein
VDGEAAEKEDAVILELFEDSGRNVQRASELLRDLFADYPEQPELAAAVRDCEHEGDRIAHEILSRLAERGTALDAADVHALTGALDNIVDYAEEAADQLGLYRAVTVRRSVADVVRLSGPRAAIVPGVDVARRHVAAPGCGSNGSSSTAAWALEASSRKMTTIRRLNRCRTLAHHPATPSHSA